MKRNLGMRFISYLLVFVLVFSDIVVNPENIMASGFTIPTLVATTNNVGIGSVQLNWSNNAPYGYFYKGLFSKDGIDWDPMPMLDLNNIQSTSDKVRVLQIYPDSGSGQLISWMITNGYGKNIVIINEVSISNFNTNPSSYLYKDVNGVWNYGVLFWYLGFK